MARPLCFVMLPFQPRLDRRNPVNFPAVFDSVIAPAIEQAGMVPLRSDEDPESRGVFQKAIFERLTLCEFAVADLTHGNPNVYYELGIRHAIRPYSTILLFREGWALPLDVAHDAAITYSVDSRGEPTNVDKTRDRLAGQLRGARAAGIDSPVHQLVSGLPVLEIDHERIDSFRDRADQDESLRRRLRAASRDGIEAVRGVEASLGQLEDLDIRSALALILAYRSLAAFDEIVRLVEGMATPLSSVELIQQQYAWALNRSGKDEDAERVAKRLVASRPSSETYGILGRIQKDRWKRGGSETRRRGHLRAAIEAYVRGFETDPRDPYPGINALSLMTMTYPRDARFDTLYPVVDFANERRIRDPLSEPDFWDYATDLNLAVLQRNADRAHRALEAMLSSEHDLWQVQTTSEGLEQLRDAWSREEDVGWMDLLLYELRD